MPEKLIPLKLPPGFANNGTVYQTKGRWHSGNLVRFYQGNIQPVGGWVQRTLTGATILGVPRTAHSWRLLDGTTALAVGTTAGIYVIVNNVVYDIVGSGDTMSNIAERTWTLDNFGYFLVANEVLEGQQAVGGGGIESWVWDSGSLSNKIFIPNAVGGQQSPQSTLAVVTTPEQFMVLLGGSDPNGIVTDPSAPSVREVFFASQSTTDTWVAAVTNTAGAFELATTGTLVAGKRGRSQTLLWTTNDFHLMTFIGGTLVYSFADAGSNCGAISSRAMTTQDTMAIWMGTNGFFYYDGFVKSIPCELQDYIFGDLNRALVRNIWALSNPTFGEVWWFYPSSLATENDSYVIFNYRENHWSYGRGLVRTAGCTQLEPGQVPVMFDASGNLWNHETGSARTSGGTVFIESGPIELGDGDNIYAINRLIPDERNLGDVNLTLYGQYRPLGTEVTYGPFTMANEPANVRVKARQMRARFTQVNAADWRIGDMRLGVVPSGRR